MPDVFNLASSLIAECIVLIWCCLHLALGLVSYVLHLALPHNLMNLSHIIPLLIPVFKVEWSQPQIRV